MHVFKMSLYEYAPETGIEQNELVLEPKLVKILKTIIETFIFLINKRIP